MRNPLRLFTGWLRKDEKRQQPDFAHAAQARRQRALWVEIDLMRRAAEGKLPVEPGPKQ